MARGKIITDPRVWLQRQIDKAYLTYYQSPSTAQRDHLQDKIQMLETCLYGLDSKRQLDEYKSKVNEYERGLEKFKETMGITVMEFIKLKEKEQTR